MSTLANTLDQLTAEGTLYERLPDDIRAVFCLWASLFNSRGQARNLPGAI